MSAWLKSLIAELDALQESDFMEPAMPSGVGDNPVGTMDVPLRKLFTLFMGCTKSALEVKAAMFSCKSDDERKAKELELVKLAHREEALKKIFWTSIRHQFNLWDKPEIGVRTGYAVVWSEPKRHSLGILGALLGGGDIEEMLRRSSNNSSDAAPDKSRLN